MRSANPNQDHFLIISKQQGYVPSGCTLDGQLVLALVNDGQDPCADCNADRNVCKGRPNKNNRRPFISKIKPIQNPKTYRPDIPIPKGYPRAE
ncbi:MAG: hypothetical protein V3U54_13190 [Thermodesulfobacteriota bacterium]